MIAVGPQTPCARRGVNAKTLALLSALYFVEGVPWGFQSQALPIFLRQHHESLTIIGLLNALSLPWMTKALWAPLVDRYGWQRFGRRKSWIVPLQIALMLSCLYGATVAGKLEWKPILGVVFLMNACAATMDIAVDALAVDVFRDNGIGTGNITQVVGYKAGSLVSGGLLVWATQRIGWSGLFVGMALLILPIMLVTALMHEPAHVEEVAAHRTVPSFRDIARMLREELRKPGTFAFFAFVGTYKLGEQLVDSMFKPFLIDSGFTASQVGLWVSTYGMAASLSGSFVGGILASRWALLRAVSWSAIFRLLPLLAVTAITLSHPSSTAVIATTVAEHFFGGLLTTATFALMMSRTEKRMGATHYSVIATVEMLGKAPIPMIAGPIAERFGYTLTFGVGAAISAMLLFLLLPLRKIAVKVAPA
ncbi:MAG: MFS transporter [Polyangiaceae bacterium]